jgi:hypothetical protein
MTKKLKEILTFLLHIMQAQTTTSFKDNKQAKIPT